MKVLLLALLVTVASPVTAQSSEHQNHSDMAAPRQPRILAGYGDGGFPIVTENRQTQAFFNNGMQLAHAFAHHAAVAAMQEARRLDPTCAMCAWGEAWAGGPTINFGKDKAELKILRGTAKRAAALARKNGNALEVQLTKALVRRYTHGGGGEAGDLVFAEAMQAIAAAHRDSDAFATIAADAWMQAPSEGKAQTRANMLRAMALLMPVLQRNPDYTPAIHFFIHATEVYGEGGAGGALCEPAGGACPQRIAPRAYAEPHFLLGRALSGGRRSEPASG